MCVMPVYLELLKYASTVSLCIEESDESLAVHVTCRQVVGNTSDTDNVSPCNCKSKLFRSEPENDDKLNHESMLTHNA